MIAISLFNHCKKGVCPYQYIDNWEKFNEKSLPGKEDFYRRVNMEDVTDADYLHAKRVSKDFETTILG